MFVLSSPIYAQPVIETLADLDFGVLAVPANDSVSTLELPFGGRNPVIEGNVVIIEAGQPGRYRISGFPAYTNINVDIDSAQLTPGGTGAPEPLAIDRYEVGEVRTNEFGEAEFQLGARLATSGSGIGYGDAPYSGIEQMRLHFWEPGVGDYVTVSKNIAIEGELRTSIALDEVASLRFGTLFAVSSPDDQASIRLQPDGRVNVINSGKARLVSLSAPQPGVLVVSGAAANRAISIDVQQAPSNLRHESNPAGPYFILSDLETSPATSGRTDENGQLEISVGGTLSTQLTPAEQVYPAGTYTATYSVTVSY